MEHLTQDSEGKPEIMRDEEDLLNQKDEEGNEAEESCEDELNPPSIKRASFGDRAKPSPV